MRKLRIHHPHTPDPEIAFEIWGEVERRYIESASETNLVEYTASDQSRRAQLLVDYVQASPADLAWSDLVLSLLARELDPMLDDGSTR